MINSSAIQQLLRHSRFDHDRISSQKLLTDFVIAMPRRLKRSVILEEYAPLSTEKVSRSTLGMSNAPIHVSNATHCIGGAHDEARDQQSGRGL